MKTTKTEDFVAGVDAGLIWIGDPCYLFSAIKDGMTWSEFCDFIRGGRETVEACGGVLMHSGMGDGVYPVTVEHTICEIFGDERPGRATIEFYPDYDEEDED